MSPKQSQNTERINVFLSKEILNSLKDEALNRGTNVSALSRSIIMEWLFVHSSANAVYRVSESSSPIPYCFDIPPFSYGSHGKLVTQEVPCTKADE